MLSFEWKVVVAAITCRGKNSVQSDPFQFQLLEIQYIVDVPISYLKRTVLNSSNFKY